VPAKSVARQWNELLIDSIRHDFARPPMHARNLYHISAAMWDAWATYDLTAGPCSCTSTTVSPDPDIADIYRNQAISFASYRLLLERFATSPGFALEKPKYDALMGTLGFDINDTNAVGQFAVGHRQPHREHHHRLRLERRLQPAEQLRQPVLRAEERPGDRGVARRSHAVAPQHCSRWR